MFYADPSSPNVINDINPSTGNNYDEDADGVPDYAERIYSCLVTAYNRYQNYYNISATEADAHLRYVRVDYVIDPVTNARSYGDYYPVTITTVPRRGLVEPVLQPFKNIELQATRMFIDRDGINMFPRDPGGSPKEWLYPTLESTIYHEMAHVYQGINTSITRPWDLADFWMLEGMAVYTTDQALIPPCSNDRLNPPRISGMNFPVDCRNPTDIERDSQIRFTDDSGALFQNPWLGLRRDELNLTSGTSTMAYSVVAQSRMMRYSEGRNRKEKVSGVLR